MAANSTCSDMDCNGAKMSEGLLEVRYCKQKTFFETLKCYKIFNIEDCHSGSHCTSDWRSEFSRMTLDILIDCTVNGRKEIL